MKFVWAASGLVLLGTLAFSPLTPKAQAAGSLSYDDPGMHFKAPDGWERIDVPSGDATGGGGAAGGGDAPPAAVFMYDRGRLDQRTIIIDIKSEADSLDAFERGHESDLRQQAGNDTHVDKRTQVTLSNGMPAYLLQVTSGDGLASLRRYEYLVYDGTRDIDVAYFGHQGEFDEKDALAALSSLYVVAYPHDRP